MFGFRRWRYDTGSDPAIFRVEKLQEQRVKSELKRLVTTSGLDITVRVSDSPIGTFGIQLADSSDWNRLVIGDKAGDARLGVTGVEHMGEEAKWILASVRVSRKMIQGILNRCDSGGPH